jgi:hypothetical protein
VPPPLDANHCYNGKVVVAAFHTHPNPPVDEAGQEWEQGPSESDQRWHKRRKLRGFVISRTLIYELDVDGTFSVHEKTQRGTCTMILQLSPLLEGLQIARNATADAINPADEVTVDDQGDHWIFEFIPQGEVLGGGARVWITKDNFKILKIVRTQ